MKSWPHRVPHVAALDDEANSEIADGSAVVSCHRHRTSVGDLPTSSVSAPQLVLQ